MILDTNVISELMKPEPSRVVLEFLDRLDSDGLYTTSISVAEIGTGLALLPTGRRRVGLASAADALFALFSDRILDFDVPAAQHYGHVVAHRTSIRRPIAAADAMIAAICLDRGWQLATRNVQDFSDLGIDVLDPWVTK